MSDMTLKEKINKVDLKEAMRNRSTDKERLVVIRQIKAAIENAEIELRKPKPTVKDASDKSEEEVISDTEITPPLSYELTDEEVLDIIAKQAKDVQETIQGFVDSGRENEADVYKKQLSIFESYLPKKLEVEQIIEIVQATIDELGITEKREMGKLMPVLMPKVKGKADGKLVNQLVQSLLK